MICRNCKFILQGSEKFCPDCGQECKENTLAEKQEEATEPSIFSSSRREDTEETDFCEPKENKPARKRTSGPAFLIFLLIFSILTVGGFTAIEYFDLAPVIMSYISSEADSTTEAATEPSAVIRTADYSDNYGIVSPDISFTPAICHVASDRAIPLRKGPDGSYAMLCLIDNGVQLQIIGGSLRDEEWVYAHVPSEECYGWLSSSFIVQSEPIQNNEEVFEDESNSESSQNETAEATSQEETKKGT